jgi:hypothetical protein
MADLRQTHFLDPSGILARLSVEQNRRNALSEEVMDTHRLFTFKEEMEKAEARKLQPYFILAFFRGD